MGKVDVRIRKQDGVSRARKRTAYYPLMSSYRVGMLECKCPTPIAPPLLALLQRGRHGLRHMHGTDIYGLNFEEMLM